MSSEQPPPVASPWSPHPGQRAIMAHDARFRIVACGRRWGKSEMAAHISLRHALANPGATVWWVGPTYDDANDYGFDNITPLLTPDISGDDPKRTKPREIPLNNGSVISFRSAEREDSLRGGGVDLLVIDESASVPERAWTEELRPTLSDTLGEMLAIGTPKGRNWFWRWFQRGQDPEHPDVASWRAPTYQNPHVPDEEIDSAQGDMPDRVFEQEYLAEFLEDGSAVFPNLSAAIGDHGVPIDPDDLALSADEQAGIGVDFARHQNWTAIVVLSPDGRVVACDRLRETSWARIQARVEALASEYGPATVAVDASRDNKIVSDLDETLRVRPITFTAQSKTTLVENLITRVENGSVTLPAEESSEESDALLREMRAYEFETTKRGNVHYAAPEHAHDDCVDALALAVEATRGGPRIRTRRGTHGGDRNGASWTTRNRPRVVTN